MSQPTRYTKAEVQRIRAEEGLRLLRSALECFKASDNRQTADRVRRAISSAKGAVRICEYRETREERAGNFDVGAVVRGIRE